MAEYNAVQKSEWLRGGIAAAKAGRRDQARELLLRVIEIDERSEQAWLWLSGVVDTDEDRLICLENVLTLNPENIRAWAGLRWLQERGVGVDPAGPELLALEIGTSPGDEPSEAREDPGVTDQHSQVQRASVAAAVSARSTGARVRVANSQDGAASDKFMTPAGCVYCGLDVTARDLRCPHCGGRLVTRQYKKKERSLIGNLLHAYWIFLAGLNVADFFIIGYVWNNVDQIPAFFRDYLPYLVGSVVLGETTLQAFLEAETLIQGARFALLALALLALLDAVGLFLRRPLAHTLGLALVAVHLLLGVSLFVLGFLGFLMAAFRGVLTVLLTVFMFNTVEDFSREERRERLEPDRHVLNDADYYTRGRAYAKRGMWAKALLHWRRAAAMNPNRDTYFAATARAYARLGRHQQALVQIGEAIRVSHTPEEWHPLRALIEEALQQSAPSQRLQTANVSQKGQSSGADPSSLGE